jgi:ERCC4-type nuclease
MIYKMKIIVDEREASLFELLTKEPINDKKPKIEKRVIPLGDILFTSDDESVTYQIIERKSVADLLASVKDGRYAEQSYRLSNCFPNKHNILYLIEGQVRDYDKKLVFACMASLNYFKGFSITRTVSLVETAQYIEITADKIAREIAKGASIVPNTIPIVNPESGQEISGQELSGQELSVNPLGTPLSGTPLDATDYCSVVKVAKKANITRDNIGQLMLMQIPGISSTISCEIMKPFTSFSAFIDHLRNEPTYLDNIMLETNGKKRKLGSNVIAAIRGYLL